MSMKFFRKMSGREPATPPTPSQEPAKVQPRGRLFSHPVMDSPYKRDYSYFPPMEQPSKNKLTFAQEKAIFDAMRPTAARQRAQSRERKEEKRSTRENNTQTKEEKKQARQSYPAHPRMSQARQAAARALWEAPLTGTEWHEHPTTGRLVPADTLNDDYSSGAISPTDRFGDNSGTASRDFGSSSPNTISSDPFPSRSAATASKYTLPPMSQAPRVISMRSKPTEQVEKIFKHFDTQPWTTPGEESQAYIDQISSNPGVDMGLRLRRSRSVPSCRSLIGEGRTTTVQIDGASMRAVAAFEAPIRPMPQRLGRLSAFGPPPR